MYPLGGLQEKAENNEPHKICFHASGFHFKSISISLYNNLLHLRDYEFTLFVAGSKIYVDWRGGGTLIAPLFSTQKWYFLVSNPISFKFSYGPFLCKKLGQNCP